MRGDLRVSGRLHIEFCDEFGVVTKTIDIPNRVVATGLRWVVDRMCNGAAGVNMLSMAIGDGNAAVDPTNTGLAHETARVNLVDTGAREEASANEPSANYTGFFDVGTGTGNVSELALFLGSGALMARTVIPTQAKSSTTSIRVKWTITLKSA